MTNYTRSNDSNRNDIDLLVVIKRELQDYADDLKEAVIHMQAALDVLQGTSNVEEFYNSEASGLPKMRYELSTGSRKFQAKIDFLTKNNIDDYIGDIAAALTDQQVEDLKRSYP